MIASAFAEAALSSSNEALCSLARLERLLNAIHWQAG